MASPTTDRRMGLVGNVAMKAPATVVSTSNITLSGEQTIDGVGVLEVNAANIPDRVLVVGQTDDTENGIYDVSTAAWTRSKDANGSYDLAAGSSILVVGGTRYANSWWSVSSSNPITVGTSSLNWSRIGAWYRPQSETQTATAGQTVFNLTSMAYSPGISNLQVFVNGLLMRISTDYVETSSTVVTFTQGLIVGDEVVFLAGAAPSEATSECIAIACSDETTALLAGTGKATFRMPYAMTVTSVRASLSTAQTSGNILTVDINDSGTTILSTKLTIDNGEKTSTTANAPAVISDSALADDAEISIDIDQIGDGTAKGLKVYILGVRV